MSMEPSQTTARELVVERVFNAPREVVWKAWTDPEELKHWWGPKGFTLKVAKMDFRPGGSLLYSLGSPGGQEMWGKFVYREISAPERLVFVNSFSDADGNMLRAPMSATWPLEILNTLTLTGQNAKTLLTIRGGPINATPEELDTFAQAQANVRAGLGGTFDQLDEYLAARQVDGSRRE